MAFVVFQWLIPLLHCRCELNDSCSSATEADPSLCEKYHRQSLFIGSKLLYFQIRGHACRQEHSDIHWFILRLCEFEPPSSQ